MLFNWLFGAAGATTRSADDCPLFNALELDGAQRGNFEEKRERAAPSES